MTTDYSFREIIVNWITCVANESPGGAAVNRTLDHCALTVSLEYGISEGEAADLINEWVDA